MKYLTQYLIKSSKVISSFFIVKIAPQSVSAIGGIQPRRTRSITANKRAIQSIIKSLISQKYIAKAQDDMAESRVDYLADILGMNKSEVISAVERMRQEGILADSKDITAYLNDVGESENRSRRLLERFIKLERYILSKIPDDVLKISCKQLNDNAQTDGIVTATEKDIRTLLYFLAVKGYARKREDAAHNLELALLADAESTIKRFERRQEICCFAIEWLFKQSVAISGRTNKNDGRRWRRKRCNR